MALWASQVLRPMAGQWVAPLCESSVPVPGESAGGQGEKSGMQAGTGYEEGFDVHANEFGLILCLRGRPGISSQVRCTPKPRPEENLVSFLMDVIGSGGFETWPQNA